MSLNLLNSVKTFRENSIVLTQPGDWYLKSWRKGVLANKCAYVTWRCGRKFVFLVSWKLFYFRTCDHFQIYAQIYSTCNTTTYKDQTTVFVEQICRTNLSEPYLPKTTGPVMFCGTNSITFRRLFTTNLETNVNPYYLWNFKLV